MRRRGPIGRRSGGTAREQTFASPFPNAYTFQVDVLATGGGFAGPVVYAGMWTPNVFYP